MSEITAQYNRTARVAAEMCADLKLEVRKAPGQVWEITNPDNGKVVALLHKTISRADSIKPMRRGEAVWTLHVAGTPRAATLTIRGTFGQARKTSLAHVLAFLVDEVAEAMMPQFKVIKSMLAYREAVKPGAANPWRHGIAEWYEAKLAGQKIQFKEGVFGYLTRSMNLGFNGIEIIGKDVETGAMVRTTTRIRG